MKQILIVEDNIALNSGLCRALNGDDRHIVSCNTLRDAREQIMISKPTLVLLDINLPDGIGFDLLKEIKAQDANIAVILLTANDTDMDIVEGLEIGADDYITKPFSLSVLRARVNVQLRKASYKIEKMSYIDGKYMFDFESMIFTVSGVKVELSKTEQRLLKLLVLNASNTMSRSTLIDKIWTDGSEYVDENALSVAVKRLRDKLKAQDRIKTVYGLGYCWLGEKK